MIRRILCSLLPALFLLAAGCASLIQAPQVTLKRTNLIGMDTSGADLEFFLGISNPNSFDLSLLGYTYDLRVMTLPLAASGLQSTLPIPAERETDMRLPVRVKFGDLLEILKRRPDPAKVPYHISRSGRNGRFLCTTGNVPAQLLSRPIQGHIQPRPLNSLKGLFFLIKKLPLCYSRAAFLLITS